MEYISHEDFKGFMNKFQAETPKGLLKEDFERPDSREMEEEDECEFICIIRKIRWYILPVL